MHSNPPVTLKTVAQACGLAVTTVSRALNGHEDIASATRAKVKQVAAEIGYIPNRQGQALRTGQTRMVNLVVPSHAAISGYTSSIIFSMGALFRDEGYELSAIPAYADLNDLELIRSIVENRRCDGIILTSIQPQDLRVRYLIEHGLPFVTHGRTELASSHAFVDFDNESFAERVTERLIRDGRKRLMLIGPSHDLTYANHMKLGFLRATGRTPVTIVEPPPGITLESPLEHLRASLLTVFSSGQKPDGVVCGGELAALAVLAATRDAGLVPGKDIAVAAKQTSSVLDYSYPPIDTCFEDINSTGTMLAQSLLSLLRQEKQAHDLATIIEPVNRWRTDTQ